MSVEIYGIISACLIGCFIICIAYGLYVMLSKPKDPYPSIETFQEKVAMIRNKIEEANSLQKLEGVRDYAVELLLSEYTEEERASAILLGEHLRLRRLELDLDIEDSDILADKLRERLKLKKHSHAS